MSTTKCFANVHMKCDEYGLWEVCRSLSHPFDHKLFFNGPELAKHFSGDNKNHIYNIEKRLVEKGWFVTLKKAKRGAKGMWEPSQYRVLSHDEWTKKHGTKKCKEPFPLSGMDEINGSFDRSRNQEHTVPEIGNTPFPKSGHSTAVSTNTAVKAITAAFCELDPEKRMKTDAQESVAAHVPPFLKSGTVPFPKTGTVDTEAEIAARRARYEKAKKIGGLPRSEFELLRDEFEPLTAGATR